MLYRTFHSNSLKALMACIVVMLLLWVRVFLYAGSQPLSLEGVGMPLWSSLIVPVFGQSVFLSAMLSFMLNLAIGLSINRLAGQNRLLEQQSMLPMIVYTLLVSGFLVVQRLNPVWLFSLFFLFGMERLLDGSFVSSRPQVRCFDAAFLVTIGIMFFGKGLFLFPLVWVAMGLLRLFSLRSFVATILGLILPFALSVGYFFFIGKTMEFYSLFVENLLVNTGQFSHHFVSRLYLFLLSFGALISIISLVRYIPVQKIITRKHFRVIIWLIFLTASASLTPFFSVELIPVFSVGVAIAFSFWLEKIKNYRWQEVFFVALFVVTIAAQILI